MCILKSPTSHHQKSGAVWYRISKSYRAFTNFKLLRNQRGYLLVDSPLMLMRVWSLISMSLISTYSHSSSLYTSTNEWVKGP